MTTLPLASPIVQRSGIARLPTRHGPYSARAYKVVGQACEHLALTMGEFGGAEPPLVRIHSECLTGDVFGSRRCDCGPQLDHALATIAAAGRGVVVYLRGHEGRGIGLSHKLRAYQLQDAGFDTVDANVKLGFPVDMRDYGAALAILGDLGIFRMRLMTNNPDKVRRLSQPPFEVVERVPVLVGNDEESRRYIETKRDRLGHYFD
ncbi:MAG: GTP cyclohydrolase II [Pseudomonadota bacterium]|nr:GTP cyclohydrolase II [Pseudomonadota bacterium]